MVTKLQQAVDFIRGGNIDAADRLVSGLVLDTPSDPAVQQIAALVAFLRGNDESAERHAIVSLRLRADHPATLVLAGRIARKLRHSEAAIGYFRQAHTLAPHLAEPGFFLCTLLLDAGDPEAIVWLSRLNGEHPDNVSGWTDVGLALYRAKRYEAALAAFTRACRSRSSDQLHQHIGTTLRAMGRAAEAIAAYGEARKLDPRNFEAAFLLGQTLKDVGARAEAAVALTDAADLRPDDARTWFALGVVEEDRGRHAEALAAYEQALTIDPNLAEAHVNSGICQQQLGDLRAAKTAYGRALRIRPDTFGRISQALTMAPKGELWLDLKALRAALTGFEPGRAVSPPIDAGLLQ